jgi:chorismate mutase/prephenate dehydratase
MRELSKVREDIDKVDNEIVELYKKRLSLAEEVAGFKIAHSRPVYDKKREEEKLLKLSSLGSDEFEKKGIRELFSQVMSGSRKRQYAIMAEAGRVHSFGFTVRDRFDFSNCKIAYQGVEGAYSEAALVDFFGSGHNIHSVPTWRDAFNELRDGISDYAVLPIENSTAGVVSENYDLLSEYSDSSAIVGEQIIKIDHALLGLPGARIEDIRTVISHPQALMQCRGYLDRHPEFEKKALTNTAMSAMKVRDDGDSSQAAIAGKINAGIYGLTVLEESIQDDTGNETRFLIVSGSHEYLRDAGKLSISFTLNNDTGSLYHVLSNFTYNGLNMSRIESRPLPGRQWEYRFFIDCDGNLLSSSVQNMLRGLEEETNSLQILGNY